MATELITKVWCDSCLADDKRVEAPIHARLALDGDIREIDFCEEHAAQLLAPVRTLIQLGIAPHPQEAPTPRGRQPSVSSQGETYSCPACPRVFKTRQTFRGHLKKEHGMGFDQYLKSVGREAYPCDECDFVGVDSAGLALHKSRVHTSANGRRPRA